MTADFNLGLPDEPYYVLRGSQLEIRLTESGESTAIHMSTHSGMQSIFQKGTHLTLTAE